MKTREKRSAQSGAQAGVRADKHRGKSGESLTYNQQAALTVFLSRYLSMADFLNLIYFPVLM